MGSFPVVFQFSTMWGRHGCRRPVIPAQLVPMKAWAGIHSLTQRGGSRARVTGGAE